MGCACAGRKKIIVTSECSPKGSAKQNKNSKSDFHKSDLITNSDKIIQSSNLNQKKRIYFQATSINNWLGILDFLSYRDLKQIGKVNR